VRHGSLPGATGVPEICDKRVAVPGGCVLAGRPCASLALPRVDSPECNVD